MASMTGQLLVATPTLKDPNFDRTVVLLVAHEAGGALGVVLNRATEVPVAEVLGGWSSLAREPSVLFEGGPVQPDRGLAGAGRALHADRLGQLSPDQLVLFGLDGGDDVPHRADPGPLDLRGQDA